MNLAIPTSDFVSIKDIVIPASFFNRIKTGDPVLDSMFGMGGSGILPGSTMTLKSRPGVGKSVFALTLGELLTNKTYKCAYVTGEEDAAQVAYNCQRLGVEDLKLAAKTDVHEILGVLEYYDFMVIDSFQTLTVNKPLNSTQTVKYCIDNLVSQAKLKGCAILFIVQETGSGEIRGGPTLSYAVDVNMEVLKLKDDETKRLFDIYKNRFGPCATYEANFKNNGYEFLGEYTEMEDMKEKTKKVSVKETRKGQILNMTDPFVTIISVSELLGVSDQTTRLLMVDLENDMSLIKFGRGGNAIWKLNKQ